VAVAVWIWVAAVVAEVSSQEALLLKQEHTLSQSVLVDEALLPLTTKAEEGTTSSNLHLTAMTQQSLALALFYSELRVVALVVLATTLRALLTPTVLQVALVEVCLATQITMKSAAVVLQLKLLKVLPQV
jgi:hypothetical protein